MENHSPSNRIPSIDGLRAVGVLLVIISHGFSAMSPTRGVFVEIAPFLANGHLGVSIFFVISGYLITTLLLREWSRSGTISLRDFYLRRSLRIFPAFYAYLTAMFVLNLFGVLTIPDRDFWSAGLYVWNYDFHGSSWFLGHFWSLALEEQFYLLWPLALMLATPKRASAFALGVVVLMPASRVLTYFLWPESRGHLGMMLHTSLDLIMFGCLAALWSESPWFLAATQPLLRWPIQSILLTFLLIISPLLAARFSGGYTLPFGLSAESMAITLLLLGFIHQPKNAAGLLLNTRPVAYLGSLSYSLYIWQQPFLTPENTSWTGIFPVNIACIFVLALLSHHLVERPFLALKDRLGSGGNSLRVPKCQIVLPSSAPLKSGEIEVL